MQEGKEWVSGEGWISDESNFYGDEEEEQRLKSSSKPFQADEFWNCQKSDLNYVAMEARNTPPVVLHNLYEGVPEAWQLNEPVQDFLRRLPPVTTSVAQCPWIWVGNPYPDGRDKLGPTKVQEDFVPRGRALLEQALQDRERIRQANAQKAKSTVGKLLNQRSEALKQSIESLAADVKVLTGKWMLFPELDDLARVWKMIVEGTISNRLGCAAKVATDQGGTDRRLICVYTKDFRDTNDVLRVLNELVSMGLVNGGKGIYYKSDAYTYLDIYGANASEYGLQASVYSSQKMLASAKSPKPNSSPQMKQSRLSFAPRRSSHVPGRD